MALYLLCSFGLTHAINEEQKADPVDDLRETNQVFPIILWERRTGISGEPTKFPPSFESAEQG